MWKDIEIKPNDQNLVGRFVKERNWNPNQREQILFVGQHVILCSSPSNYNLENSYSRTLNKWQIWEEERPKKLLAPAIYADSEDWLLGSYLYSSYQEAKQRNPNRKIIWPAIPNKDGYYVVEK